MPADITRNTGVCFGRAAAYQTAKVVTTIGFNYRMTLFTRCKTGPQSNYQRSIRNAGSQIFFGNNGVDQYIRLTDGNALSFRINQNRNLSRSPDTGNFSLIRNRDSLNPFHRHRPFMHRLAKSDAPPDSKRRRGFKHQNVP